MAAERLPHRIVLVLKSIKRRDICPVNAWFGHAFPQSTARNKSRVDKRPGRWHAYMPLIHIPATALAAIAQPAERPPVRLSSRSIAVAGIVPNAGEHKV